MEQDFTRHTHVQVHDSEGPLMTVPVREGEGDPMEIARREVESKGLRIVREGHNLLEVKSMTETETRHAVSRVTWCMTTNAYADETTCHDGETGQTKADHDHYDVALDQHDKVLFRYWPIGTTWRTSDGYTMRLRKYDRDFGDMIYLEDRGEDGTDAPPRPQWDGVAPSGGAFGEGHWLPGPGDVIVEYVLPEGVRPPPGSLFACPNGEAWRLQSYTVDWTQEPFTGDLDCPRWTVHTPFGASTNGKTLPDDARLVWHP